MSRVWERGKATGPGTFSRNDLEPEIWAIMASETPWEMKKGNSHVFCEF